MVLPQTQLQFLLLAIFGMICLGCWAHGYKLAGKWRFELFYLDVAVGFGVAALIYAFTLGTLGFDGFDLMDDLRHASSKSMLYGIGAGLVLNLGTLLLIAAVSVAGIAFAFVIGIGLSMVVATTTSLIYRSSGHLSWVLAGMLLTITACAIMAMAHAQMVRERRRQIPKDARGKPAYRLSVWKGILLAVFAAPLLGLYYPLVERARRPEIGFGPYAVMFVIAAVVFGSTIVFSLIFMNLPVEGEPVDVVDYVRAGIRRHTLGLLSGALWSTGILAMLVASETTEEAKFSSSAFEVINWSAPLLAAILGMVLWKEFQGAPGKVRTMVLLTFLLFAAGIALMSFAPTLMVRL